MTEFKEFASAVSKRFAEMSKKELYVVDANPWDAYLAAFPEGSDPIFRKRTEHDCSTCRHAIRNVGNVVEIVDGELRSIWYGIDLPGPYGEVAAALNSLIASAPLAGLFRVSEARYGNPATRSLNGANVETWHHFCADIAGRHRSRDVAADRGEFLTSTAVFRRGLKEITPFALDSIVELIDNNILYRGAEHLRSVAEFRTLHSKYAALPCESFVFANARNPAARFRNSVIGTLAVDLSTGVDLEIAVRSFELKVAPTNYKRPKALITAAMVADAMKTIASLGIEQSLERRFARLSDVSVTDVLWVDRNVRSRMRDGGIGDILMAAATSRPVRTDKAETMSIEAFMKDVLPNAVAVEMLVKNAHEGNFVSLTAGVHLDCPPLFKWSNNFAWSYRGNVTDSIKEKVKRAGGNVTAPLRVSLAWFNSDDLDIHVYTPNGKHIYYNNRMRLLDVDMNAGGPTSRTPVENVSWARNIVDGKYRIIVNNYSKRETSDVGFVIETESNGRIENYRYDKAVGHGQSVHVGYMTVQGSEIVKFVTGPDIIGGSASKVVWGVATETFVPVSSVMHSPNFWDGRAVGNKHYVFALSGCTNNEPTRGIYNEFLHSSLDKHRKVFEVLGDKTKCQPSDDQVSGLGFSSTSGSTATVKVDGRRIINIQF